MGPVRRAPGRVCPGGRPGPGVVSVELVLHGRGSVAELAARLQEIGGVLTVHAGDQDADG